MAISRPTVQQRFDDWIAVWSEHPRAKVCFKVDGATVIVSDITRATLPKGCGGDMIAQTMKVQRLQPTRLRALNVLDKQEEFGRSSANLLTDVLRGAAVGLNGIVTASRMGQDRDKVYVEVDISY